MLTVRSVVLAALAASLIPQAVAKPVVVGSIASAEPTSSWTGGRGDKARAKELLKEIREQADAPQRGPFEQLASMGNQDGLDALVKAVSTIQRREALEMLFTSISRFSNHEDLADEALEFLLKQADSNNDVVAAAAVPRMKAFGAEGAEALREIAESGRSALGRAHAIGGLRKELKEAADEDALELVLHGVSVPESGPRKKVYGLVRAFQTPECWKDLERYVGGKKSDDKRCLLLLSAMGSHPLGEDAAVDAGVILVLTSAIGSKSVARQFGALSLAAERGVALDAGDLTRLAKSKDSSVRRAAFVAGLQGDDAPFRATDLAQSKDPLARQAAAVGFADLGAGPTLEELHRLMGDEHHVVRLAAIEATEVIRSKDSIPFLIGLLETETGRLRGDARRALKGLTGKDLGLGAGSWKRFWAAEKDTFVVPTEKEIRRAERKKARKGKGGSAANFYGIEILSDRFALIVDTSGSMQQKAYAGGTRMDVAKKQLNQTLDRLKDGVQFNVISFDAVARAMKGQMAVASKATKKKAHSYVDGLRADGGTNIYAALRTAFDDEGIDTIYLMSDGDPSIGEIIEVAALRAEVARWNSARGVVIHCIAVGQPHELLKGLAEDHNGTYVVVN